MRPLQYQLRLRQFLQTNRRDKVCAQCLSDVINRRHCPPTPAALSVVPLPNITHVFYGRDVGYIVERIVLDDKIEAISATQLRRLGAEP